MWNLFLGDKFLLQMLQPFPSFLGEFQFLGVCLHSLTVRRRKTHVPLQNVFTPGRMVTSRKASHLHHLMQRPHVTTEQLSDPENFSISLHFIFSWNLAVIRVAGDYCVRRVGFGFLHLLPPPPAAWPPYLSSFVPSGTFSLVLWKPTSCLCYPHIIVFSTKLVVYYEGGEERPRKSLADQYRLEDQRSDTQYSCQSHGLPITSQGSGDGDRESPEHADYL